MWTRESHVCDEAENMKRQVGKIAAAFLVLVLATGAATRAQKFTVLHSFTNSPGDGGKRRGQVARGTIQNQVCPFLCPPHGYFRMPQYHSRKQKKRRKPLSSLILSGTEV